MHVFLPMWLPYPWPPSVGLLLLSAEHEGQEVSISVLPDGRFTVRVSSLSLISQPVDIHGARPEFALIEIVRVENALELLLSGDLLLEDKPGGPRHTLKPGLPPIPHENSFDDPNAVVACQSWIQKRRQKFSSPASVRGERHLKTLQDQADDLRNSALNLRDLQEQVLANKPRLLGHLAAELRSSIYWPRGTNNQGDSQPPINYNPLLLRMASVADLPLPVYGSLSPPPFPNIGSLSVRFEPLNAPRTYRLLKSDKVHDLQESIVKTIIQLGPHPAGRSISALNAIKEFAHTMGVSHYDEHASNFLEVIESIKTSDGDELTNFMCHTAEAVASLSEWVLSELKVRNLIS